MIGNAGRENPPDPIGDPTIQALMVALGASNLAELAQKFIAAGTLANSGAGGIAIGGAADNAQFGGRPIELTAAAVVALEAAVRQVLPKPRCNLPAAGPHFKGRGAEEAAILQSLHQGGGAQAITSVTGIGGTGTSALAVRVARQLVLHYPAAQILVNLRGTDAEPAAPREVAEEVIRRFQPEARLPDDDEAVRDIYRDILGRHRSLLILDNARDGDQVRALLPPPPSAAIITARQAVALPGVVCHGLDSLGQADAVALLAEIFAERAAANRPDDGALEGLALACAGHPLALMVAGAYAADGAGGVALEAYTAQILERRESLQRAGQADHAVMASLVLRLERLTADAAGLAAHWRDLAVFPGDFDAAAAAAVWAPEAGTDAAQGILAALLDAGLVGPGRGTERFCLHGLMRGLAGRQQPAARRAAANARHGRHFAAVLSAADNLYAKGGRQNLHDGLALYDLEGLNIRTGQARAVAAMQAAPSAAACDLVYQYVNLGVYVLGLRLQPRVWILWAEAAAKGARLAGNRRGEASVLGNLGRAHANLGELDAAIGYYQQAFVIAREIGDRHGEASALGNLGLAHAGLGQMDRAIAYYRQQLIIAREIGDRVGEGSALGSLGNAHARRGETDQAIARHDEALDIFRQIGDRHGEGNVLGNLGNAYADLGEVDQAISYYQQQLVIARGIGDRRGEGNALANLGLAHESLERIAEAREAWTAALALFVAIDDPNAENLRQWLASLQT